MSQILIVIFVIVLLMEKNIVTKGGGSISTLLLHQGTSKLNAKQKSLIKKCIIQCPFRNR